MTTMDDRDVRLLTWFGDLVLQAEEQLARGAAPDWLKERINQGEVRSAVRDAGLPLAIVPGVGALMLALFSALKGSKPGPTRRFVRN